MMEITMTNETLAGLKKFEDGARRILGDDFISSGEVERITQTRYRMREHLVRGFPDMEALCYARDRNMFLTPVPPRTGFLDVLKLQKEYIDRNEQHELTAEKMKEWGIEDKFSDLSYPQWIMLEKTPIQGLIGKTPEQQKKIVKAPLIIPSAPLLIWGLTIYKTLRGKFIRCQVPSYEQKYITYLELRTSTVSGNSNIIIHSYSDGWQWSRGGTDFDGSDVGIIRARVFG